jgi:FKBP-type peptidyl-prolyl cis-trans isomerase
MNKALVFLFLASCFYGCMPSKKFKTTEGEQILYRYVEKGKGIQVDSGKVAEVYISQYLETVDSVYQEMVYSGAQGVLIMNPGENPMIRSFMLGKVGDSLTIKIPNVGQLRKMTPPNLPETGWLRMEFRILSVEEQDKYEAKKAKEMEEKLAYYKIANDKEIQVYMKANGMENVQKTESGLYYMITEEGNGEKPEVGGEVEIHYTGTLLDGTKFDSSIDRGQIFKFQLGVSRVISGWSEGISLLSKGAKGTLLIPSHLGFGAVGSRKKVPPFSSMKFDIELVNIFPAQN